VVERDEKEQGERKLLNLGHTIGHAIEKCSGFTIPHGHAVAAGLAIMTRAAENLGWMTGESKQALEAERIESAVETLGLPSAAEYPPAALAQAALRDKKRAGDSITIVVPSKIGRCELKTIPVTELQSIIEAGWALE
jgi:3-dehydroquinate synthase